MENKQPDMQDSMECLRKAVDRLRNLHSAIAGPFPPEEGAEFPVDSLAELLCATFDEVRRLANRVEDAVNSIRAALREYGLPAEPTTAIPKLADRRKSRQKNDR